MPSLVVSPPDRLEGLLEDLLGRRLFRESLGQVDAVELLANPGHLPDDRLLERMRPLRYVVIHLKFPFLSKSAESIAQSA